MGKEKIESLVEGGKASAGPPLGPALGPMGVNIGQVISAINEKTASFKGMQVPVTVTIDTATKECEITVGTPPASALIKKEAGIEKGASNSKMEKMADLRIEQIIKIAKMKEDNLLGKTPQARVKEIIGTCNSLGILVEGVEPREAIQRVNAGEFDEKILSGKTELTEAELKELAEEKKRLIKEMESRKAEFEKLAKQIIEKHKAKTKSQLRGLLNGEGIPSMIYEPLLPSDKDKKK